MDLRDPEVAQELLTPYLAAFYSSVKMAAEQSQDDLSNGQYRKCTRANAMHDKIVENLVAAQADFAELRYFKYNNQRNAFLVADAFLLCCNKLDNRFMSRSNKTPQARKFLEQTPFGLPGLMGVRANIILGHQWADEAQTIPSVFVTLPLGIKENAWILAVLPGEGDAAVSVQQITPPAPRDWTAGQVVLPRFPRDEKQEGPNG